MFKKLLKNKIFWIIIASVLVVLTVVCFLVIRRIEPKEEPMDNDTDLVGELGAQSLEEVNPEAIVAPLRSPNLPTPTIISDTIGTITSIEKNGIRVMGTGYNFEDQIPRELFVEFYEETITFKRDQKETYQGLAGLKQLKVGERVLISSSENIRGKTSFTAYYINKIE